MEQIKSDVKAKRSMSIVDGRDDVMSGRRLNFSCNALVSLGSGTGDDDSDYGDDDSDNGDHESDYGDDDSDNGDYGSY